MTSLIISSIGILLFIIYNIVMFILFGMPASLSNTYYYLNDKKKGAGWAFTAMMWTVSGLLIGPWIDITNNISSWSQYLTVLPFLTCACLLFVATAPNFRDGGLPNSVHMTCAKLAAVFALLWVCVVCWKIMYIVPIWILLLGGIAHLTKTAKSGRDWWVEMCAFGPTFTAIIIEEILQL